MNIPGLIMRCLLFIPLAALADADCVGHACNDGGGDVNVRTDVSAPVDVQTSVSPSSSMTNKSRSFGFGLGDVDIAQCYRSYSAFLWQDSRPNYWCMADSMDARGLHDAAAKLRCKVKGYAGLFGSVDECEELSTMRPAPVPVMAEPQDDDDEDYHEEMQQELDMLRADLQASIDNLKAEQSRPAPRPVQTTVEQKLYLDEKQAQDILSRLKGNGDE